MKHLREKLPRLNRRQRIARNLVLAALMLFFAWAVTGFAPPTDTLCARWTAERYGLSEPEILLRQREENNTGRHYLILRWSDGRVAALETYRKFGFLRRGGRLQFGQETDGAAQQIFGTHFVRVRAVEELAKKAGTVLAHELAQTRKSESS